MKIEDIFIGDNSEISLRVRPSIKNESFKKEFKKEVQLTFLNGVYWLVYSDSERFEVCGITDEDDNILKKVANKQKSIVLLVKSDKNKAELEIKLYASGDEEDNNLEFGYTNKIIELVNKKYLRYLNNKSIPVWIKDEVVIYTDGKDKILINFLPNQNGFIIFGKNINIEIQEIDNKYEIKNIRKPNPRKLYATDLMQAEISIQDISSTAKMRSNISSRLNKLDTTRYLHTWEKYKEKEKEKTDEERKEKGFLTIKYIKYTDEYKEGYKYKLFFKHGNKTDDFLEIEEKNFLELLVERKYPELLIKNKNPKVKLLNKRDTYIVIGSREKLKLGKDNKSFKFAVLSLLGDEIQQSRKEKALEKIRNNTAPMASLAGILENISIGKPQKGTEEPLSSKVKEEFGGTPNPMQREALDKALNTPDIAIIQGPPGTGKTKVISALTQRLSELYKARGIAPEKNILLTAYQHEAVDNMSLKTEVLGLPTIRIGKNNDGLNAIDIWIKNKQVNIEAKQHELEIKQELNTNELIYNDLKVNYIRYLESSNHNQAIDVLKQFKKENILYFKDNLEMLNKIDLVCQPKKDIDDSKVKRMEGITRNIRVEPISYEDDGKVTLTRFITNYKRYQENIPTLKSTDFEFLQKVIDQENLSQDDFEKLETIQITYLEQIISNDDMKESSFADFEIEKLFKELIDFFAQQLQANGSIYTVLSEYQNDLSTNWEKLNKTIEQYSALLASTIQGSVSKDLLHIKDDPFDTVIVDEAARPSPLDLLIPLTSARQRIILVGDHRQLPHILDSKMQSEIENSANASEETKEHLEDSLFERFFRILTKLQKKDGIKRVVTLNTQYRMHPAIGDFISKTFYEKHGDDKIFSGNKEEALQHNLSKYAGKVAVSINIPHIKEKRQNGSFYRPEEAKEAIKRAKDILDLEDNNISVGIITFYSRQVEELKKIAIDEGLYEESKGYEKKVAKKYQKTEESEEKFKIGSVDSFQGKEFDVVILSTVRANSIKIKNEMDVRKKYGFLTSYNRLNVAMSRARKLIICIGDEVMFKDEKAKEHIYGLYAFHKKLIGSEYGCSI